MGIAEKGNVKIHEVQLEIEKLLRFAEQHLLLKPLDVVPARNALLDLFQLDQPYTGEWDGRHETRFDSALPMLEVLLDYAAQSGLLADDTITHRDLFDAKVMGLLMPKASEVAERFWRMAKEQSIEAATSDYYELSIASTYIRMERIRQNKHWLSSTPYGDLEITINLSKPEKDPKTIAAERLLPQAHYPQCVLCEDNVGYAGRLNHPARQNHRIVPMTLTGEAWFLQYSPYVYYNEHAIVLKKEHVPMQISHDTFARLLDFIEQFPHYFIGSNADLPIVGGSILNHDHFQGGRHSFPMELALIDETFTHQHYPGVTASIVKWPMSVIRLSSSDRDMLLRGANEILDQWREYSDSAVDIEAYSQETPHNTITPIARMNKAGQFELDLVLRNNRTTEAYPYGLFHPHEPLHHIKKENIGLIEVMGLAILPGRLLDEIEDITRIMIGELEFSEQMKQELEHPLFKHATWITELLDQYGNALHKDEAETVMEQAVGDKFLQVLQAAGVFKRDERGQSAFRRFMKHLGYE